VELSRAVYDRHLVAWSDPQESERFTQRVTGALGAIRLIGSRETRVAADRLFNEIVEALGGDKEYDKARLNRALEEFRVAARKDLGH
jgi:hypothetical protein